MNIILNYATEPNPFRMCIERRLLPFEDDITDSMRGTALFQRLTESAIIVKAKLPACNFDYNAIL